MKRLIILGGLAYTVAAIAVSLLVIKPPKPLVEIRGESLGSIGPLDILNSLFSAWVIMALLLILCFFALRKMSLIPSGFYNLFEATIEVIYDFVVGLAGEHWGRKFFPLIATFFIYITFANWMSLTPIFNSFGEYVPLTAQESGYHNEALVFKDSGGISLINPGAKVVDLEGSDCATGTEGDACRQDAIDQATSEHASGGNEKIGVLHPYFRGINTDLMTPLSFALVSAFFVELWGIQAQGVLKYGSKFLNFKGPIDFFVGILEFVAEVARLLSFSFRLFGNMLAGEIVLLVMTFLLAVASPIVVVFYGLELFVGAVQAFIFGALTLVFAILAITSHDDHGHEEEAGHQQGAESH